MFPLFSSTKSAKSWPVRYFIHQKWKVARQHQVYVFTGKIRNILWLNSPGNHHISANSGLTIRVMPFPSLRSNFVQTKYTILFPQPVRCTTSVLLLVSVASIAYFFRYCTIVSSRKAKDSLYFSILA